jgi:DNA-directed RNA polymerase subunit RPC12/RpoP
MAFQFMCPRGHLLEGDESQGGQQCRCPQCGMVFIIPMPAPAAVQEAVLPEESEAAGFPGFGGAHAEEPDEPRLLHIPCPNGHELETPLDMLGQEVLCPHCNAQFQLREKDSVEFRRQKKAEMDRIHRQQAKAWMNWAVALGVIVVLAVIGMIVMTFQ